MIYISCQKNEVSRKISFLGREVLRWTAGDLPCPAQPQTSNNIRKY